MKISAQDEHFQILNKKIRSAADSDIQIDNCIGQRYICAGLSGKSVVINGIPGNALGAYLDGSAIVVNGNAQDATGDTMNSGEIIIHGNAGDATGYAMRGGAIYVKGSTGYRAGIHMKAYKEHKPLVVIGGKAGSFLGEYQAGGTIIVLGLDADGKASGGAQILTGAFCGTGMHGGAIYLRTSAAPANLPVQISASFAKGFDLPEIIPGVESFCEKFGFDSKSVLDSVYCILKPNTATPYKQMYTLN